MLFDIWSPGVANGRALSSYRSRDIASPVESGERGNSVCGDATLSTPYRQAKPAYTHQQRAKCKSNKKNTTNSHSAPCIMFGYGLTFPVVLKIYFQQRRLPTHMTLGYVLDAIRTCSSASPRLLFGMALCNYCQCSHRHHVFHTQPSKNDLSHTLAYLHISK